MGGIGGRVVMLILRLTSDANGLTSDDGFTIGQFSLLDSAQLYAGMALFGAVNGASYVAARQLLPRTGRLVLWGVLGAAVVGSAVVKTDGLDFNVLEPRWFAIASFVALPGLAALLVAWLIERCARIEPWRCSPWLALLVIPALPALVGAPLFLVGGAIAVGLGRIDALRRLPDRAWARMAALTLVLLIVAAGAADLARDTAELL